MKVTVRNIYISGGHNYYGRFGKKSLDFRIIEREKIDLVAGKGVVGDRFFNYKPNYKGQITFFEHEVYEKVKQEIVKGELSPIKFRRNVVVEGIGLNTLIGKRFRIGDVEFTGSCECKPCFWMDEACAEGTFEFLKGQGGLRARILSDGELALGEYEVEILGDVEADG